MSEKTHLKGEYCFQSSEPDINLISNVKFLYTSQFMLINDGAPFKK